MGGTGDGESGAGLRLYNLDNDIGEKTNVADANPEVVKRLQALAVKMRAELCDGSPKGPGVRPPGTVEKAEFLFPVKDEGKKKGK